MKSKGPLSIKLIIIFGIALLSLAGVGLSLGSAYIDELMLNNNKQRAVDLVSFVAHNFRLTDAEVAHMRSLDFTAMENDPINRRLAAVATGFPNYAKTTNVYIAAPVPREQVKYITDASSAKFFNAPAGTPLDTVWLLNVNIKPDGTPNFTSREDIYRYTPTTADFKRAFTERSPYGIHSKDAWGEFITGYTPIYTVEGSYVGVMGIDVDLSNYQEDVHKMVMLLIMAFALTSIMLFCLFLYFYSKYERAQKARMYFDFYSRMSHDMRTPMNGILGLVALSENENRLELLHDYFKKIGKSGDYLLRLINDTLDVSKINNNGLELNPEPVSLQELVENVVEMSRDNLIKRQLTLREEYKGFDAGTIILVDPMRFKQVLMNLLSNAIKFTPENGTIDLRVMAAKEAENRLNIKIVVADTGVGMSRDFIDNRLFKPFAQEQNDTTGRYIGTGLGLSIVKSIVELAGGAITVDSTLGKGTVFTVAIALPLASKAAAIATVAEPQANLQVLQGKRLLLCEDHPLNAEIASRLLIRAGCQVQIAENGKIGLEHFETSPEGYYSAILMDIRMPVMDGLRAARAIRSLKRQDAAGVPIIAMTANAYNEDRELTKAAGMNAHLAKPISPKEMLQTIADLIQRQ